jgi:LmbE family N-acetylglucosaminyl deacetylase
MWKCFSGLVLLLLLSARAHAQPSSLIAEDISKLQIAGTVLYVAAHPDDENTRFITWLSKERKVQTAYLSITRGDGGQNLIGKEQGDALGVIRTQELLAARRIDGGVQYFTRANDFGYSKTPEETLEIWNKDSVLSDVVWVIRKLKPDVIICRFPTTGEGGHGHHTASAILALEAFTEAANPQFAPHQLRHTETWQAKRILWNTFNFGTTNTTSPDQLQVEAGLYNPLLGKSYGEIAAESRTMHKSQGFGSSPNRAAFTEYFKPMGGDEAKKDVFEGIDFSWTRFSEASQLKALAEKCASAFKPAAPEESLSHLIAFANALNAIKSNNTTLNYYLRIKRAEVEQIMLKCLGFYAEATTSQAWGCPGNKEIINLSFIQRSNKKLELLRVQSQNYDTLVAQLLQPSKSLAFAHRVNLPDDASYSQPYWLSQAHPQGAFVVSDLTRIGQPENDLAIQYRVHMKMEGYELETHIPVNFKTLDPVKGELIQPYAILPPAVVQFNERVMLVGAGESKKISFAVKALCNDIRLRYDIEMTNGWKASQTTGEVVLKHKGDEQLLELNITNTLPDKDGLLTIFLTVNGKRYAHCLQTIEYDHIPHQYLLNPSELPLLSFEIKRRKSVVGYIPGAGDEIPEAMTQLGYQVVKLDINQLHKENLSVYETIVTGVRAYNTLEKLQNNHEHLMNYISQGGTLVVQYNTNNRIGPLLAKIGPYPFSITRERVTEENAEVRILKPSHRLMTYPYAIQSADFENWVQERGIYFSGEADVKYEELLSMNDKGQKPANGSLICAPHGKGYFVYTGLSFFRQLPAGVKGAYRLFANLIELNQPKP